MSNSDNPLSGKNWKYLSFGLIGGIVVLAVLTLPVYFGSNINARMNTSNNGNNVPLLVSQSIDDKAGSNQFVTESIDNVAPSTEPVRITTPQTPAQESIVSSVLIDGITMNAPDEGSGGNSVIELIPPSPGKSYSGHIQVYVSGVSDGGPLSVGCFISPPPDSDDRYQNRYTTRTFITESTEYEDDFACFGLYIGVADLPDGIDAGDVRIKGLVQYVTSSSVTTVRD